MQVVRQDVLPGELDPGGFPRRYQYLVGAGEGVLYVGRSRLRRALGAWRGGRPHEVDVRRHRQAGRPSAGQGVVGDRSAGQRDQRRLTDLVGAVALRRAGGEERVHRPPDLVIGVERAARRLDLAPHVLRIGLGVVARGSSAETIGPSSTATARSSRGAVTPLRAASAATTGADGSSARPRARAPPRPARRARPPGCCAAPAARAAGGDCR